MAIVRGNQFTDSEWSGKWTRFNQITSTKRVTRSVFTRETLVYIRRWIERIRVNFSDTKWQSCVTSYYRTNNISFSESDTKNIIMVRRGGKIMENITTTNTNLSVQRSGEIDKYSSSKRWDLYVSMYKNTNRYLLSVEDRIKLWTAVSRGRRCSDSEWNSFLSKINNCKSSFHVSKSVWTKDVLVLVRKWLDRIRHSFSDDRWKSCAMRFYQSNQINYSDYDVKIITYIHSGGSYSESTSSQQNSSQKTVLAASGNKQVEQQDYGISSDSTEVDRTEEVTEETVREEKVTEETETSVTSQSNESYSSR